MSWVDWLLIIVSTIYIIYLDIKYSRIRNRITAENAFLAKVNCNLIDTLLEREGITGNGSIEIEFRRKQDVK